MITVTHATTGQEAEVFPNKIFAITTSDSMKCTILITGEGGQFPINETKDEVLKLIKKQKITAVGGNDGRKER